MVLITYDIDTTDAAGRKRLRRIAKACVNFGQRVQASVFECDVDAATLVTLKAALLEIADPVKDSLRIYHLGNRWQGKVSISARSPVMTRKGSLRYEIANHRRSCSTREVRTTL